MMLWRPGINNSFLQASLHRKQKNIVPLENDLNYSELPEVLPSRNNRPMFRPELGSSTNPRQREVDAGQVQAVEMRPLNVSQAALAGAWNSEKTGLWLAEAPAPPVKPSERSDENSIKISPLPFTNSLRGVF
jgi:hypothetical protein